MATKQSMIQAKYDAKNSKVYSLKFNRKTDAEIIEKLDQVESRNGYIKQLIREDLARTRTGSVPVSVPDSVPVSFRDPYSDKLADAVGTWIDNATSVLTDEKPYISSDSVPKTK